jgi:hypothetical protein
VPGPEEVEAAVRAAMDKLGPGMTVKDYVREVMVMAHGKLNPGQVVKILKEIMK